MAVDRQTLIDRATALVQLPADVFPEPGSELEDIARGAVNATLIRFARIAPRVLTVEFAGTGARYYDLSTVVPGWIDRRSDIEGVEYPAADLSAGQDPNPLTEGDEYEVFAVAGTGGADRNEYLRFLMDTPSTSENVRLTARIPHVWTTAEGGDDDDSVTTTLDDEDIEPFCWAVASSVLLSVAAKFGSETPLSAVQVEQNPQGDKVDSWRRLATEFDKRFRAHYGLDEADDSISGLFFVVDVDNTRPARDMIFYRPENV